MSRFFVSAPGTKPAMVEAGNWLAALGDGLDKLGVEADFSRLACEVLPNGTVIAQDVRSGSRFVVRPELEETRPEAREADRARTSDAPGFQDATDAAEGFASTVLDGAPRRDQALGSDEVDTVVPEEDDDEDEDEDALVEMLGDEDSSAPPEVFPDEEVADPQTLEPLPPDSVEEIAEEEGEAELELLEDLRRAPSDLVAWQMALNVAMVLVPSEAGSALQQEPDGGVRFVGTRGPNAHRLAAIKLPRGTGIVGFCMDRIASIIVQDPKNDPRFFKEMDAATGFATRAVLCVPVALEGDVYGCLELVNPPEGLAFTRTHIELVELVAGALADRLVTGRSPS